MMITGKALTEMKERNCGNCQYRNEKYKILGCKLQNKQTKQDYCCILHSFEGWK